MGKVRPDMSGKDHPGNKWYTVLPMEKRSGPEGDKARQALLEKGKTEKAKK